MLKPGISGGHSASERAMHRAHIGRTGATGSIETRLTELRLLHDITSTVDPTTGARTLTIDGHHYTGATLTDCLALAGIE